VENLRKKKGQPKVRLELRLSTEVFDKLARLEEKHGDDKGVASFAAVILSRYALKKPLPGVASL
jgi:hypothetical protein